MTKEDIHLCECGCGQETAIYRGKSRRFINGHTRRGVKVYDPIKYKIGMEGITQDIVRELFDYRDGELYWKLTRGQRKMGAIAGGIEERGYRSIGINYKMYLAHRLIFLYHHGYLPEFLDHIDGDKSNNCINNLRAATTSQNGMNMKKPKFVNGKPTTSIYKGVAWNEQRKKWCSQIKVEEKIKHLGRFTSEIKAAEAYNAAAIKYYGEFACLNIIEITKH